MGFNSRLDSIQGAVLSVKLKYLDKWTQRRREITDYYNRAFEDVAQIVTPEESSWAEPVYHLYVIQVEGRDSLKQKLNQLGIGAGIHYPRPLHLQQSYSFLGHQVGSFPVSERVADRVMSLPNYPEMTDKMLEFVVEKVREYVGGS
jgi:dTDP-4-amino-4,6-dideoxygalactose transaminase